MATQYEVVPGHSGWAFQFPEDGILHLDSLASAVIFTLAYFAMFQHPLRKDELAKYLHFCPLTSEDLSSTLARLGRMGLVGTSEGFYFLTGQEYPVPLRKRRAYLAQRWVRKIKASAWVLGYLPFLEGLALSGSLSKGTQGNECDIDFMALCRPGRLWTCRFFLVVVQRLLPPSVRKRFCVNLLLSSDHLLVRRKNLFIATEIAFLKPLINGSLWQAFFRENAWVSYYYPEWTPPGVEVSGAPRFVMKRFLEWAFSGKWGDWFENNFRGWMSNHIQKKLRARYPVEPLRHNRTLDAIEIGHSPFSSACFMQAWTTALNDFEARNRVRLVRWPWNWE